MVYITTKDTPKAWRRAGEGPDSAQGNTEEENSEDRAQNDNWNSTGQAASDHRNNSVGHDTFLSLGPHTFARDNPYHGSSHHLSCITTSVSSLGTMNHIAPGLHQTSLTLASPVLGCSGYLHKECCTLTVQDHWKEHQLPYIRRRSVNVPLDVSNKQ